MRSWLRVVVLAVVGGFVALVLVLLTQGRTRGAAGALVLAALMAPLLLEAAWPGKYVLRKPEGGMPDNAINRIRQFRRDHPGADGSALIAVVALVAAAVFLGMLVQLGRAVLGD